MGLNDNVYKVNQAINEQSEAVKKDNEYKQYLNDLKTQFKEIIQSELMEAIQQNKNIFDNEYKIYIINNVVEEFQKYSCSDSVETLRRFLKYKTELKSFLFQKYYSIANQCRMMQKKTAEYEKHQAGNIDYKQKIAIEKWDLQRQKEKLKIKQLEQKIAQNEQKYNMKQATKKPTKQVYIKRSGNGSEVAKVLLYLMFAPIVIFGLVIYGFISAASKTK